MIIFDRSLIQKRQQKVAPFLGNYDYLYKHSEEGLLQRLSFIKRPFDTILILGRCTEVLTQTLQHLGKPSYAAMDEEGLSFKEQSFDLILVPSGLHAVDDVPGILCRIRNILKPDGLFLASFFGGETLTELRQILFETEVEKRGGASPRIFPFIELATAASLLGRANFSLPVADRERLKVTFTDMYQLMSDLKGMGESNSLILREKTFTPRSLFKEAAKRYLERFSNTEGRISATFEILYLTGWRAHASQQKALKPGSARHQLADVLKDKRRLKSIESKNSL